MRGAFIASVIFALLGIMVIALASYAVLSYATSIFQGLVDFVASGDYGKLQQCGISPPPEMEKLKNDFPTLILPALYLGIPVTLIILSVLMFISGRYFERAKQEELREKEGEAKEAVRKVARSSGVEDGSSAAEGRED